MPEPREDGPSDEPPLIGGEGSGLDVAGGEGELLERDRIEEETEGPGTKPRSMWSDAWRDLRRNPIFVLSALLILFLIVISIWPSLIATRSPLSCNLARSLEGARPGHWFGFDTQGCDVYTRTVYGARASVAVGVCATAGVTLIGGVVGGLAGFFGGWRDGLLSRVTDIFFGIPLILGALVFLSVLSTKGIWPVVGIIAALAWPQIARIARGAVITAKQHDYVQAARALGAGNTRIAAAAHPAQRRRPGDRRRHHRAGHVHRPGGHPQLSRRRPAAADRLLGRGHLRRLQRHAVPQRAAHPALPGGSAERHGAGVHHDGRRGP